MDWRDRIAVDPAVCHGAACVRGSRVMVSVVMDNLAEGSSVEDVCSAFHITEEDVRAAIHYAAELTRERLVFLPAEAK